MKRYTQITIAILFLAGMAAGCRTAPEPPGDRPSQQVTAPEPLGYWPMEQMTAQRVAASVSDYALEVRGDSRIVDDKRFGRSFEIGGTLELPAGLVEAADETGALTLAFWFYTPHSARDASWKQLLQIRNPGKGPNNAPQDLNLQLRWNRILVRQANRTLFDTGYPEGCIEPHRWLYLALTWTGDTCKIFFNGEPRGDVALENMLPGFKGTVELFSKELQGRVAHLRVLDRELSGDEIKALMALNMPKDLPGEKDPAPNCPGETLGEKKRETDYTIRELKTYFPPLEQWTDWKSMSRLDATFAKERFRKPPRPYAHPRVLFNAEDLPAIRERLQNTVIGRKMMQALRGRCLQLNADPSHWEAIPYGAVRKSDLRAEYLQQSIDIGGGRSGFHGPWLGGMVEDLAAGKMPAELEEAWGKSHYGRPRHYLVHQMPYEAFRCLIDEDDEGLARIGRAVATLCRRFMADPEIQRLAAGTEWQPIYQRIHSQAIGLTYDFAYNRMSKRDRDDTRRFIAMVTSNKKILPTQHLPAFPANTTNWLIIHANMLPMILAIEGEDGYDVMAYERMVAALKKWVYVTCGPLGAPFEGFNKSGYAPKWLTYLAKRGVPLCGTTYSKNVARKYNLHMMVPWGGAYIYETEIGRVNGGIEFFKFAHPTDPVIDMMYGYTVKDRIQADDFAGWPNIRTTYPPVYDALFVADDPIGVADGAYDWDAVFDRTMKFLENNREPLSYYSDYRGVMTARSGWDKNAVMFYMEPRNVPGGHTHASRNEFLVMGLGRKWSDRPKSVEAQSEWHSVVLIDGQGQGQGKTPAGRTVAVEDHSAATFLVGDAAWAYSYSSANADTGEPIPVTPNQSRLRPSPLPWMDQPWSFLPQWFTGGKPGRKHGAGHSHWKPYNTVKYAFRTGGLVRGKYPYVLVVDDIRKDDVVHDYTWQMQLADDLTVEKAYRDGVLDLTLVEDGPRRCVVRVVEAGGAAVNAATAGVSGHDPFEYVDRYKKPARNNRLTIKTESRDGMFKTLIYPYTPDRPALRTEWNKDRTQLTVTIGEQRDLFTFEKQADGRTAVRMKRAGRKVF